MISPLCGNRATSPCSLVMVLAPRDFASRTARAHSARDTSASRAMPPIRIASVPFCTRPWRVTVARRGTRLVREIRLTARIDERRRVEAERAVVVERVRAAHDAGIACDRGEPRVQDHVDARGGAEPVQRKLHRLGLDERDHDVGAARAHRPAHPAERFQRGEHLGADPTDGAPWRIALRPEAAVREHAAARRRAAEKRSLLEQSHPRAAPRGPDRRRNAGGATAANHDVVTVPPLDSAHHLCELRAWSNEPRVAA